MKASRPPRHNGAAPAADLTGDVEAVHVRQTEVEDHEVRAVDLGEGTSTGAVGAYFVPLPSQGPGEGFRDGGVVFNEEHCSHGAHHSAYEAQTFTSLDQVKCISACEGST